MNISNEGISLIKKFEGCKLQAYYDAINVPTIAYGRTKGVTIGDTCTQEQADKWLEEELNEYGGYVIKINEKGWDEVPNQIKRWNKAGGKVLEGLVRRREAESLLFQGKEWIEV